MKQQTFKQRLLQATYPALMKVTRLLGANTRVLSNKVGAQPHQPVYPLSITLNSGQPLQLDQFKGRKLLLVNTASNCGYTGQYEELQQLWEQYNDRVQIIGFPANDFKEQEKGSDADIEQFCKINYGVQFPLAKKSSVVKGPEQHPLFAWLSDARKNGWNDQAPEWNFSKYLINEKGELSHYFGPSVSPLNEEVIRAVEGR